MISRKRPSGTGEKKLCPYHNKVSFCTKDKANEPLGVCTISYEDQRLAITCPVRFRQDWIILEKAADFFFESGLKWTMFQEIRLKDKSGRSAGNIDFVLVAYDANGQVHDFGALEVQAVYISGNIRRPFEYYMANPEAHQDMVWKSGNIRPDYLSSSRKRLIPQVTIKGGILKAWGKKMGIVLHENFYSTLPQLPKVEPEEADIAWFIYGLDFNDQTKRYRLAHRQTVYTSFEPALKKITTPSPGNMEEFIAQLQERLDEKLDNMVG